MLDIVNFNDKEIQNKLLLLLDNWKAILPASKDALILLKPNLNNDLHGLLGGTTDLRVLAAVIRFLKKEGFRNIIIGDGPNTGVFHSGINVFSRLKIDKLAKKFNVHLLDFNKASYEIVPFGNYQARIAKVCFDCDFFINLPKIKTHTEAMLSISLKNLVGCLVGYDKILVHLNYHENILRLKKILSPNLHIVDGLIGMEGNGPSRGTPKKVNTILIGENPFLLDLICSKLIGFDYEDIPYLKLAIKEGILKSDLEILKSIHTKQEPFSHPKQTIFAKLILKNYRLTVMPRYTSLKFFDKILSSSFISKLLYILGSRSEMYIKERPDLKIYFDKRKCIYCNKCVDYCPFSLPITSPNFSFNETRCIKCLYCYFVCPNDAIKIKGTFGFLTPQIMLKDLVKRIVWKNGSDNKNGCSNLQTVYT